MGNMTEKDNHYLKNELYELISNKPEIFQFIQVYSLDGLWYWDLENPEHEWMSPEFWQLMGYDPSEKEHLAKEWQTLIDPDDLAIALDNLKAHCADPSHPHDQIVRYQHKNGSTIWVRCRGIAIRDLSGKPIRMLGTHNDVTELKKAEESLRKQTEKLRASEKRYRLLAENTNDLIALHQPNGQYIYVSPSCQQLLGYDPEELLGQDPYRLFHPEDHDRIYQQSHRLALASKHPRSITYRIRQKSGRYIWFETLTKPILNPQGEIIYLETTSREVTQRIQAEEQLKFAALHDSLTGLPNRDYLLERLDLALKQVQADPSLDFSVLSLDLDDFKMINDSLGHFAGDEVLINVANLLTQCTRESDLLARLGGDEFVIFLEGVRNHSGAIKVAENILKMLRSPLSIQGREIVIGTSIGIAWGSSSYLNPEEILRDADLAAYRAKALGKGKYVIFNHKMHLEALQDLKIKHDLRRAVERNEFILYYQPIIELKTGKIRGFESLIRWQHPERGFLPPNEFIEAAENSQLIIPMGRWIIKQICQQSALWQDQFPDQTLTICLNLSPQQLREELLEEIDEAFSNHPLLENNLVIEITENMLMKDVETIYPLLSELKERGFQISIDDFGTGYSCLKYLSQFPIDFLKIDRSFISKLESDPSVKMITQTILNLCQSLSLNAIAEGIETEAQRKQLIQGGCHFGQGFFFSRPITVQEATQLLLIGNLGGQLSIDHE